MWDFITMPGQEFVKSSRGGVPHQSLNDDEPKGLHALLQGFFHLCCYLSLGLQ